MQEFESITSFAQTAVPFYLVYILLALPLCIWGKKKRFQWVASVIRTTVIISVVFFLSLFYVFCFG